MNGDVSPTPLLSDASMTKVPSEQVVVEFRFLYVITPVVTSATLELTKTC
jgi:hypothetical protein